MTGATTDTVDPVKVDKLLIDNSEGVVIDPKELGFGLGKMLKFGTRQRR